MFERKITEINPFISSLQASNSSTVVTIRGLKATEEGKPASVKVSFKVKKTGKASKYSYVSKVNVIDDKLTMTAEATKAKEITVTFNKPIADASKVKATVKKGSADRSCKATVDGSKIILAMDAKLIKGTYTVTVEGVADTAMTADVVVEKDEELTSYKVSSVATMKRYRDASDSNKLKVATNSAIVTYQALNQYGERMNADKPQISCTLGTVLESNISESKVNADGSFIITDMPSVMAIQGQKGNVIVVDKKNGVNTTQEVTVSAAATPTEIEIAGVYDANSNKIDECLKENADLRSGNYYILLTAKDQYTNDFTSDVYFKELTTVTIAGGLTNVNVKLDANNDEQISTRTVNGKDYIAIQLTNADSVKTKAKAGSYTLMIVNQEKGMLLNASYSVAEATIIKSISISADKGLYNGAGEQELSYDIIDQNGNAVTSYAILNDTDLISFSRNNGSFKFIKNADGSAKLVYNPNAQTFNDRDNDKESKLLTESVTLNDNTANLMVQPLTLTLYEGKVAKSVSKLKDGTATSLALGQTLKISLGDIVYADQYGNEMTAKDAGFNTQAGFATGVRYTLVSQPSGGITCAYGLGDDANKLVFTSYSQTATATVYLKVGNSVSSVNYDYKFDVVATDTKGIDASTLKIDSINGGNAYHVSVDKPVAFDESIYYTVTGKTSALSDIKVVGKMGGVDTVIPSSQYVIKSIKDNKISTAENAAGVNQVTKKTATVVVQVTTQDVNGNRTETELTGTFVISTDAEKIAKINDKVDQTGDGTYNVYRLSATNNAVTAGALRAAFTYKDQYGDDYNYDPSDADKVAGAGDVLVTVDVSELATGATASDCIIVGSETANATVTFGRTGTYKLSVKVTMKDADGKVTSEKDRIITVNV